MVIKRIKVEIISDLYLPRFRALSGFIWEVSVHKLERDGFPLGGGFVSNKDFNVIGTIRG